MYKTAPANQWCQAENVGVIGVWIFNEAPIPRVYEVYSENEAIRVRFPDGDSQGWQVMLGFRAQRRRTETDEDSSRHVVGDQIVG